MSFQSINPATEEVWAEYNAHDDAEVDARIRKAAETQKIWKSSTLQRRKELLRRLAEGLRKDAEKHALLMHREMGKNLEEAKAEAEKCALCADYYAEHATELLSPVPVATDARKSYVCFEPLGVVLAIMPWNFPYWQVIRCAVPAILAGNTVLLKHASNVSGCALELEKCFLAAGGEPALFQTLLIDGKKADALIARDEIRGVSFTGSTEVGRLVGSTAGRSLKKCVLELGGSDAYVVLKDADVKEAARICVQSRLINAGQSCINAKRFIVENAVAEEFTGAVMKAMSEAKLAPLARADLRRDLHDQVERAVKSGAKLLQGGKIPAGKGFFYPPTVLDHVDDNSPAFREEFFGPVACIVRAKDDDHAMELANDCRFGLGGAVFSRDAEKAERLAREVLACGSAFVNTFVRSDPRLPFGGIKDSGFGRELSRYGLHEFVNIKTIYVAK